MELGENRISPQLPIRKALLVDLHSCLATNKQILLKDEIKQIKMFSEDAEVRNSLTTPPSDHVIIYL